jgi:uncharacterized repeat protein (TIGR03803 family)
LSKVACILFVFCAATAIASPAQVLTTLHSFSGSDGAYPEAGLVQASDGNFYGTTYSGGNGLGTVFKITPSGTLTTLYRFCSQGNCSDGASPYAGLIQATDGNFYGTTFYGGANDNCYAGSCGTVFGITPDGMLTTLHSFDGSDGANPVAALVQGADGNFYGTTVQGAGSCPAGCGSVFKITPSGTLTSLHAFGGYDGEYPVGALIQATDGNFYGTTQESCCHGQGTVFRITPGGTFAVLYLFCPQGGCTDGANPWAGLVQGTDGNFYGTTEYGGSNGDGVVFKITPQGTLSTLYNFCSQGGCADGSEPLAGLVQASDGNFYGTTYAGGASSNCSGGCGTIFKITPNGTLTTLHSFSGSDGAAPYGALVHATDGNFYGTTWGGGANGEGTVFRLVLLRACIVCTSVE